MVVTVVVGGGVMAIGIRVVVVVRRWRVGCW